MGWIADNKDQPEGPSLRGMILAAPITPKLYVSQDPASKLRPREEVKIVRDMVHQKDRQRAAASL
jgi:hypothetical protein